MSLRHAFAHVHFIVFVPFCQYVPVCLTVCAQQLLTKYILLRFSGLVWFKSFVCLVDLVVCL